MRSGDRFGAGVFDRIDELLDAAVRQGQAPGVVAAVARGDAVHIAAAGATAIGGPPMRPDTLFRISSTTKPMTAVVVLSLVDEGVLELNEPVDRLLPELADRRVLRRPDGPLTNTVPAGRPVTIRDLLTFTWGFGMQGAMFMAPEPWPIVTAVTERELSSFGPPQPATTPEPDTWLARLGELPLLAQPGERWLYQAGSQVLGVLAARAVGAPFETVMRDRLLPAGRASALAAAALATARRRRAPRARVAAAPRAPPPPPTVTEMTRDQLTAAQRASVWPGFSFLGDRGWGYGVSVLDDGRYTWEGGLGTAWSNVPSQDLTVVVLTQRAADETGMPAVCNGVLAAASAAA